MQVNILCDEQAERFITDLAAPGTSDTLMVDMAFAHANNPEGAKIVVLRKLSRVEQPGFKDAFAAIAMFDGYEKKEDNGLLLHVACYIQDEQEEREALALTEDFISGTLKQCDGHIESVFQRD